jgi:multiple sugar transport system permease protein
MTMSAMIDTPHSLVQPRRPRPWLTPRRREALTGYLVILPWMIGFLVFTAGPMLFSLAVAGTDWELLGKPRWTGLANLQTLATDDLFWTSLWNTTVYTVLAVPTSLIVALAVAMLLNQRVRGTNIYRLLAYLPSQLPAVATAVLWFLIFSPNYGLANDLLSLLHLPTSQWIWSPTMAKPSLVIKAAWSFGGAMIIFLAGLQSIPAMLYEAARIDGAGEWAQFRHVTLPMLSPIIFFNLVIGLIGSYQVFTDVFVMTQGGPGNATLMLVLYIYQNGFSYFRMGYAALLSWVLFLITLALTIGQFALSRRWVYYEGEAQ